MYCAISHARSAQSTDAKDTDRELGQEVAALLWVSVLTDKTDDLLDRAFIKLQQSKYNVFDWAGHVKEKCTIYIEPLQVGHDDSKWHALSGSYAVLRQGACHGLG